MRLFTLDIGKGPLGWAKALTLTYVTIGTMIIVSIVTIG